MANGENSTLSLIEWLMLHDGHPLLHTVRGFCCGPCTGKGSAFLIDPEWNEAAEQIELGALHELNDVAESTLVTGLRARAERAERRCLELSREVGELKRALENTDRVVCLQADEVRDARSTIDTLRISLADAGTREGNLQGELEERIVKFSADLAQLRGQRDLFARKVEGLIAERAGWAGAHTCKPPLGNPTREEAIEHLAQIRARVQRFAADTVGNITDRIGS